MYMTKATVTETVTACALARSGFYGAHQALWRLFGGADGAPRDFLFRRMDGSGLEYLVVSHRRPGNGAGFGVRTREYDPALRAGDLLRFSLRANPVRVVTDERGVKRRVDVVMHARHELLRQGVPEDGLPQRPLLAQQAGCDWLLARGEALGLEFLSQTLRADGYMQHDMRLGPSVPRKRAIRFSALDYQGVARVADAERVRAALFNGVGKAKAFGCGLLLVRRCSG